MRVWIPLLGAALGAVVAILGTVLYQVGPDGESGVLVGRGGILFWWLSFPGHFARAFFTPLGFDNHWSTVLGNALLWGLAAFAISEHLRVRRRPPADA